ncbi:hypothetical protein [Spirillospora sp. CA-294931]|uniref:hypothetical protein n=1 Tax=Spirillospora sp. CA-294931 TaxID=3240042 RepID=UPI003D93523E
MDLSSAHAFMAGHARVLDRRRLELRLGQTDVTAVLSALDGYRNPDGGYGWGLEPDLRSPESQPGGALHAFEVFADIAPATSPRAAELCDWLDSITLPDGGLPFALPLTVKEATAPWWQDADPTASSLQITAITAAAAHRVAVHDPAVAKHPWLARATRYSLDTIAALDEKPFAYVLLFAVHLLDAVHDTHQEAPALLRKMTAHIPANGRVPVAGGTENEALHPLDFAPTPTSRLRPHFTPEVIATDLDRLASLQQPDGGWIVDYARISPSGTLDWRGVTTLNALHTLHTLQSN